MKDQAAIDRFYWANGSCCAGCDHWRSLNAVAGECTKAAPVPAADRPAMLGMTGVMLHIGAGHPFTPRDHLCGDFRDGFDWSSLPKSYLRQIGAANV